MKLFLTNVQHNGIFYAAMTELLKFVGLDLLIPSGIAYLIYRFSKEPKEALQAIIITLVLAAISLSGQVLLEHHHTRRVLAEQIGLDHAITSNATTRALKALGQEYAAILDSGNELTKNRAQEIIRRSVEQMESLTRGRIAIPAKETDFCAYAISSMKNARRSVFATSLVGSDFWISDCGKAYLAANVEVSKRKPRVNTTRIFLLQSPDESEALKPVISQQLIPGIEVRIACKVDPLLQQDFALFDDRFSMALELVPKSQTIAAIAYDASPLALEKAQQAREELLRDSTKIDDVARLQEIARSRCH